jgi:hypothetical protein
MNAIGTVVEIFSASKLLIQVTKDLRADEVLTVFAEVEKPELQEKYGFNVLHVPKGEIAVLAKQTDGFYLAEVFRPTVESKRVIEKPSSFLAGFLTHDIIKENVPGPPSATLSDPTVPVSVPAKVQVGDKVGQE